MVNLKYGLGGEAKELASSAVKAFLFLAPPPPSFSYVGVHCESAWGV